LRRAHRAQGRQPSGQQVRLARRPALQRGTGGHPPPADLQQARRDRGAPRPVQRPDVRHGAQPPWHAHPDSRTPPRHTRAAPPPPPPPAPALPRTAPPPTPETPPHPPPHTTPPPGAPPHPTKLPPKNRHIHIGTLLPPGGHGPATNCCIPGSIGSMPVAGR